MRGRLVAGNWKMHGNRAMVRELLDEILDQAGQLVSPPAMAVIPPAVFIPQVAERLAGSPVVVGAQNVCDQEGEGAFTGEISGAMLREAGCSYALVGHSERRALYAESDELVGQRAVAALAAGLTPIVCVGETLDERDADRTEEVVDRQLQAVLAATGAERARELVIAYEPVWAIGTGRTATPEQAQAVHAFLRGRLGAAGADVTIVYGGSVKADNAEALFGMDDIDGGLIGGASLKADQFLTICRAAAG